MKDLEIELGSISIQQLPELTQTLARDLNREELPAEVTSFIFKDDAGCVLLGGLFKFEKSQPHFQGIELLSGPDLYRRATQAGRMAVEPHGKGNYACRLRALKINNGEYASLSNVTASELKTLAEDSNFYETLKNHGALEIGTAEQILSTSGPTRNQLAMIFPESDLRSLAIAWGVTRISALAKRFGTAEFEVL